MTKVTMTVNGKSVSGDVAGNTLLVEFLRSDLHLTGTHVGCDTSQCGACTIIMDGVAVKSCTTLAVQADGCEVTTIEGLATNDQLPPVQAAFIENDGFQCGFCTPGQIMSAVGLIAEGHAGTDPERVREGMSGNLCRCGAYAGITRAVIEAQTSAGETRTGEAA